MRFNRENLLYMLAFVPGLTAIILQLLLGQYFHIVVRLILVAILLFLLLNGIRHFAEMPRGRHFYGVLEPIAVALPQKLVAGEDLRFYSSILLDRLEEGHATADVLSPYKQDPAAPREIIVSPRLLADHQEKVPIMVAREILKYRHNIRPKNLLFILLPFLLLINFLLLFYFSDIAVFVNAGTTLRSFLMPTIISITAIAIMLRWSKYNLRSDQKIDRLLLDYFSVAEVKQSIALEEKIEGKGEKKRFQQVNSEDLRRRLEALEEA